MATNIGRTDRIDARSDIRNFMARFLRFEAEHLDRLDDKNRRLSFDEILTMLASFGIFRWSQWDV